MEQWKAMEAIEFSEHFYESKQLKCLNNFLGHNLSRDNHTANRLEDFITINTEMKSQLEKASLSAKKNAPILLTGETRIEKDFIAQVLHNESGRYTK